MSGRFKKKQGFREKRTARKAFKDAQGKKVKYKKVFKKVFSHRRQKSQKSNIKKAGVS